jgi:hypothetical protein
MTPAERIEKHHFTLPVVVEEFEPHRHAPAPSSTEMEVDIPVAEVESVHDLSEALALSAMARKARQRPTRPFNRPTPHAA